MSKRSHRRARRRQPQTALGTPAPKQPAHAAQPERLLLDQIAQGALDPHLSAVSQAIRSRHELLQTINAAKALAQLAAGDNVRINHHAKPRYLQGLRGKVIDLDEQSATICLHPPVGRFKSGQIRCSPLALDKLSAAA